MPSFSQKQKFSMIGVNNPPFYHKKVESGNADSFLTLEIPGDTIEQKSFATAHYIKHSLEVS